MNQRIKLTGLHVFGWLLFATFMAAFVRGFGPNDHRFLYPSLFVYLLLCFVVFYLHSFVLLPRLFFRKKYLAYVSVVLSLFLLVFISRPFDKFVNRHREPAREAPALRMERRSDGDFRPPGRDRKPPGVDIISLVLLVAILSASSVQQIVRQWRTTESRALRAEAGKAAAELSFLKAQINPHFLFNTLNNIYALATAKSDRTPEAVLKLSSILRYLTDDAEQNLVSLQSEVACIRDYIDLQRLRLSDKVTVQFSAEGEIQDQQIAPLLLMTFVENAFKYGTSNHEPCTLRVGIVARATGVSFFCQNRIFDRPDAGNREGVGISNTRRRLEHLYPGKYSLALHTENGLFTVELVINT